MIGLLLIIDINKLSKQIIERLPGGIPLSLLFPRSTSAEFLVQGKPIAKVAPFLVRHHLRLAFPAIPPGAGGKIPAMTANPEIPSALTAAQRPAKGFGIENWRTAAPTHRIIVLSICLSVQP